MSSNRSSNHQPESGPNSMSRTEVEPNLTAGEIKLKIEKKEFTLIDVNTQQKRYKSHVWSTFREIKNSEGAILKEYVACGVCYNVLAYTRGQSTSNMGKHKCVKMKSESGGQSKTTVKDISSYFTLTAKEAESRLSADVKLGIKNSGVKFIARDMRPMYALKGAGLHDLLSTFTIIGCKYGGLSPEAVAAVLPHPSTISRYIQQKTVELTEVLSQILGPIFAQNGGAVTVDMWTDDFRKRSYLGVTAHYINDDYELNDRVLNIKDFPAQMRHTATNICTEIISCLRRWKISSEESKLVFVSDRGPNIVASLKDYNRLNCIEHVLNNITEKLCEEDDVKSIVTDCKKLVALFKNTGLNNELPQTLKAPADTRWNTIFYMFESIIANYQSARTLLENRSKKDELHVIDQIHVNEVSALVKFFKPFEQMTMVLQGSRKPTLCFVQPWVAALKKHLLLSSTDHYLVSALKEAYSGNRDLTQLLDNKAVEKYHLIATFLHPLLKNSRSLTTQDIQSIRREVIYLI